MLAESKQDQCERMYGGPSAEAHVADDISCQKCHHQHFFLLDNNHHSSGFSLIYSCVCVKNRCHELITRTKHLNFRKQSIVSTKTFKGVVAWVLNTRPAPFRLDPAPQKMMIIRDYYNLRKEDTRGKKKELTGHWRLNNIGFSRVERR